MHPTPYLQLVQPLRLCVALREGRRWCFHLMWPVPPTLHHHASKSVNPDLGVAVQVAAFQG